MHRAKPTNTHVLGRSATVMAVVTFFMSLAPHPAGAQGLPMFPDPINSTEVLRYAERLEFSNAQRFEIERIHDDYLLRFQRLRDRDMLEFTDGLVEIGLRFSQDRFAIPPRDELEGVIHDYDQILDAIGRVDESFFDDLEMVVDETQRPMLQRCRTLRRVDLHRIIALEFASDFNPGARASLSDIVYGLGLDEQQRIDVDPMLIGYERSVLRHIRSLHRILKNALTVILDLIDDLGLRDMTPEEMMQLGGDPDLQLSLQATFDEASVDFQKEVHELSQLNLKTVRRLTQVLNEQLSTALRDRYFRQAYGRFYHGQPAWQRRFEEALRIEGLSAEGREQISAELETLKKIDDEAVDALVDTIEDAREYRSAAELDDDPPDKLAKIHDLGERREALEPRANAILESLLGAEQFAALLNDDEREHRGRRDEIFIQGRNEAEIQEAMRRAEAEALAAAAAVDAQEAEPEAFYQPTPLSYTNFQRCLGPLQLDDDQIEIAKLLHEDYFTSFEAAASALSDSGDLEAYQRAGDSNPLGAVFVVDAQLFDDLSAFLADEQRAILIERLAAMRRRSLLANLTRGLANNAWGSRLPPDLLMLLLEVAPEPAVLQTLDAELEEHDALVLAFYEQWYDAAIAMRSRQQLLENAQANEASDTVIEALDRKLREERQRLNEAGGQIRELNEATLSSLVTRISEPQAVSLQYDYYHSAHPRMFRETQTIERFLTQTAAMDSLDASQQVRVESLNQDFRRSYIGATLEELALEETGWPDDTPGRRNAIHRELKRERMEFDRQELCARTLLRLRSIISDEQARKLPGFHDEVGW